MNTKTLTLLFSVLTSACSLLPSSHKYQHRPMQTATAKPVRQDDGALARWKEEDMRRREREKEEARAAEEQRVKREAEEAAACPESCQDAKRLQASIDDACTAVAEIEEAKRDNAAIVRDSKRYGVISYQDKRQMVDNKEAGQRAEERLEQAKAEIQAMRGKPFKDKVDCGAVARNNFGEE